MYFTSKCDGFLQITIRHCSAHLGCQSPHFSTNTLAWYILLLDILCWIKGNTKNCGGYVFSTYFTSKWDEFLQIKIQHCSAHFGCQSSHFSTNPSAWYIFLLGILCWIKVNTKNCGGYFLSMYFTSKCDGFLQLTIRHYSAHFGCQIPHISTNTLAWYIFLLDILCWIKVHTKKCGGYFVSMYFTWAE